MLSTAVGFEYIFRDRTSILSISSIRGRKKEVSCSAYQLIFDKIVLLLLLLWLLYYSDRIDMTACVDIKKE